MLSKIGNSFITAFCGLFLGAMLGFFLFASVYFIKHFTLYSFAILFPALLLGGLKRKNYKGRNKFLGIIFTTIFTWIILCGFVGSGWLMAGEDVESDFSDIIIFAILFPLTILGTSILITIRMIWCDSRLGQYIEQNIRGTKVLLGMGEASPKMPDEIPAEKDL